MPIIKKINITVIDMISELSIKNNYGKNLDYEED